MPKKETPKRPYHKRGIKYKFNNLEKKETPLNLKKEKYTGLGINQKYCLHNYHFCNKGRNGHLKATIYYYECINCFNVLFYDTTIKKWTSM